MIRVLAKRPDSPRPFTTWMSPRLESLQRYVGGYIEVVRIFENLAVICDEEGRLKGKPHCCTICGVDFVGDIVIVGIAGEELVDLPADYKTMKRMFPELWESNN